MGFPTPEGRISAVNDCGYVNLPNGTRYSIAVFVADSNYDIATEGVSKCPNIQIHPCHR